MSRLASLSTPSRSRSSPSPSPAPSPSPQSSETTQHRMLKIVITEVKNVHRTWNELVGIDGLKAGKGIIDESTTMDNLLQSAEDERPPLAGHLEAMYTHRAALEAVLSKLVSPRVGLYHAADERGPDAAAKASHQIGTSGRTSREDLLRGVQTTGSGMGYLRAVVAKLDSGTFRDLHPKYISLTAIVNSLPALVTYHNQHLATLISISQIILNPETTFDHAKLALERWRDLSYAGERWVGVKEWEELVDMEMSGGGEDEDCDEVAVAVPASGRNKKGRK